MRVQICIRSRVYTNVSSIYQLCMYNISVMILILSKRMVDSLNFTPATTHTFQEVSNKKMYHQGAQPQEAPFTSIFPQVLNKRCWEA